MTAFERLKFNSRDTIAFEEWYRETYPELFVFGYRITRGNRALAEDLCQDAIVAFITSGYVGKVKDAKHALSYLRRMVASAQVDLFRKVRTATKFAESENVTSNAGETSVGALDVYAALLEQLSVEDHEILGMLFAGEPLSRIAAELDISYSNAGVRVHRIRNLIRELS